MESCAREFYLPGEAASPWYVDFLCCNTRARRKDSGHFGRIPAPAVSYSKFTNEDTSTRAFETEFPAPKEETNEAACLSGKWITLIAGVLLILAGLAAWGYQESHSMPGHDLQHTSIAHVQFRPNHPHALSGPKALLVVTPATTSNKMFTAVVAIAKTTTTTTMRLETLDLSTTPATVPGHTTVPLNAAFPAVVAIAKTTTTTTPLLEILDLSTTLTTVSGHTTVPLKTAIVAATNNTSSSSTTTSRTSTTHKSSATSASTGTSTSTGTGTTSSTITNTSTSTTTMSTSTSSTTSTSSINCQACAPKKRDVPDVVIPFYERDLCKLQYTVEALRLHDTRKHLGTIFLVWVSTQQSFEYSGPLSAMNQTLSMTRNVHILDLSPQVVKLQGTGWVVQQIIKLKIASIISSEYYIVLDSKNTLIRDVPHDLFLTPCNQGKVWGEFRYDKIPEPHAHWYRASARALNVSAPASGYWPSSSTPMVLHKRTVLKMLRAISESPRFDPICGGPLCDLLGLKSGDGTTEFTLYVLFARSQVDFECIHSLMTPDIPDLAQQWSLSLWRGLGTYANRQRCKDIVNGRQKPFMFGSQPGVLHGISHAHRTKMVADLETIYRDAKLYDSSISDEDFVECIAGGEDGTKKKKPDILPEFTFEHEFCCTGSESKHDVCGTCWSGAVAKPGDFCAESKSSCQKCNKTWCKPRAKFRDWTGTLIM